MVERPRFLRTAALLAALVTLVATAGCGSSSGGSSSSTSSGATPNSTTAATGTTPATNAKTSCGSSAPSAGSSEAASTAQGDIPDNQNFLTYKSPVGYQLSYPEGWARSGTGGDVTFQDKGNTIAVKLSSGPTPTAASVASQLKTEQAADPCLKVSGAPEQVTLGPNRALKVTYTTVGAKSPVTGKSLNLTVDRYVYSNKGKVATLDLGTPVGVDNVDAYRMISESFRWG
jgi:hypothetical protein